MPSGEFWQFLREPIGVNPTPVAFTEVYAALQTGAIDGQDAAAKALDDCTAKFEAKEGDAVAALKAEGRKVCTQDLNAFRTYAQKRHLDKYGNEWPAGALDNSNALQASADFMCRPI